ncbi:MAG: phosphoenolpyruvate-protein phosphotransferase system enzyme [Cryptosporangiaceae bacterium]|nr:phosphoenolpyruvate-protein phosphotransferase system enzyme [Cryptosporangiaceae bacterium]
MRELTGIGVGYGTAAGPVARMGDPLPEPAADPSRISPEDELASARSAMSGVAAELRRRAALAEGPAREVLEAQALMAEDPGLAPGIESRIGAGATAARAVYEAFGEYRTMLAAAGEYLAARVADLDDVRQRVVAGCLGVPVPGVPDPGVPFVLVARDLAPADTALLDLSRVLALVTAEGGPTSHTAILARSRGLPAIVGCPGALTLPDGSVVVVDAGRSVVVADPSAELVAAATTTATAETATGPGRTADSRPVALLANLGSAADAPAAVAAGAEGVGLFRTEFLFLDSAEAPTAAAQQDAYRAVLDAFGGQKVVIRVLDAGADKPLAFVDLGVEPNPALGVRGLRALRAHPELLDTQLTAIAAAAKDSSADVWVMAPMVADAEEAAWFAARVREYGLATPGVMIEIPAAALTAGSLLQQVAFASIGTNDLAQYTMAADRLAGALGTLQDPWHPALLRLIELVGAAGSLTSKPIGVCGESAADPLLACVLVGLGATSLSMSASALPAVRAELARHTYAECVAFAQAAVTATSAAGARDRVRDLA